MSTRSFQPAPQPSLGRKLHVLEQKLAIIEGGFGGCLPDGEIVDRREHPNAIPLPANPPLNTPDPKPV
jgi:hypothetical protein